MIHSILFRCDGSHKIGFGHVIRCLALADELRENHGCNIIFAVLLDQKAIELIENHGYPVETADRTRKDFSYGAWLNSVVVNINARGIILDVRDDLPSEAINNLREKGILIATIDDPTDRRLLADFAFYPPVPQVERMDWQGFSGELCVGWEWVVLRREFSQTVRTRREMSCVSNASNILVTTGGSDPQSMTLKAIKALALLHEQFEVTIILGPGFAQRKDLNELLDNFPHPYRILENIPNTADIMAESDLAVASFGVTAYELAAMGVPAIHLCFSEDHVQSALFFQDSGMATCLGLADHLTEEKIAASIKSALFEEILRKDIHQQSKKIDGCGAARVAQLIASKLDKGGYLYEPRMGHSEFFCR
jgi:spore coat polysaccharide biosynthesis predicted glycosyltransferase SpsG